MAGVLIDARDYYRAFYETARRARRSILLLGWQFDSDVQLLRGDDVPAGVDPASLRLLPFLDGLCVAKPELEVFVLAWDHSVFFALERELLQKLWFDLRTSERFRFEFDGTVPEYGAHHQKVAIVDGRIAFLGSGDICQDRWDTSEHACANLHRVGRGGNPCKPYHEVQAAVTGDAARSMVDLFVERWADATGESLATDALVAPAPAVDGAATSASAAALAVDRSGAALPGMTYPMPVATVSLHREFPPRLGRPPVREVRDLLVDAIGRADHLLYVETQYLTSQVVCDALVARMRDGAKPKLEIVVVLPQKPEALKEELALGAAQNRVIGELAAVAAACGHAFGVFNVAVPREGAGEVSVYIHAKLLLADDRFLTIGSANLNNRSMSLDSEINVAWDARDGGDLDLVTAIRGLRRRLLSEHVGRDLEDHAVVAKGLVARLSAIAEAKADRLRIHATEGEASVFLEAAQKVVSDYADPLHGPDSRDPRALL